MPQQRLSFAQWSQRRGSSISGDLLEFSSQQSDDLDVSQKSKCLSSQPRTVSTTSSTKPRTSWVFSHMPDEEVETRYYNQRTGKEEWRCKHCDKTYASSGGTAAPAKHLMDPPPDGHGLPKGAPRTAKLQLHELLSNKLVLRQKKIPENAVDSTINPETRSNLTSSRHYT
ncbi:hypothetical protein FPOAC2_14545 [Fusarium poae]|jgi:hypothetical protein